MGQPTICQGRGIPPVWCGSLQASLTAYNSAGEGVWDYGASKTIQGNTTCPFVPTPGPRWPAQYSNTQTFNWDQDECARPDETGQPGYPNLNCPGTWVGRRHLPDRRQRDVGARRHLHFQLIARS